MSMREAHELAVPGRSWLTGSVSDFLDWSPTTDRGRYVRQELKAAGLWECIFAGGALCMFIILTR
eukprot:scaffold244034_cov15-Prasinocladus_malaysianus.AAC.1